MINERAIRRVANRSPRLRPVAWRSVVSLSDITPPHFRYGVVRRLGSAVLKPPSLAVEGIQTDGQTLAVAAADRSGQTRLRSVIATGALDAGGVEGVVSLLARWLPSAGVAVSVICRQAGRVAYQLSAAGVDVRVTESQHDTTRVLDEIRPHVLESHNAPHDMLCAADEIDVPIVMVVHNTEINRGAAEWREVDWVARRAAATIAVSDFVARHHLTHLTSDSTAQMTVVPNASDPAISAALPDRTAARRQVAHSLALPDGLRDEFVFLCLARYDSQKNIPGLVRAFGVAGAARPKAHLIVAGHAADRLEYRWAESLRRSLGPVASQVHLLTHSDSATLLAAADAFVLDSFFEGWPLGATEAVTAGLPLIVSEVGGARELVGPDGQRGIMVPNPCGNALEVSQRTVRMARRARRQVNEEAVADALVRTVDDGALWAERRAAIATEASTLFGWQRTIHGHADVISAAGVAD
jgi:glycosyltransferase involved in cell wall biosynthesis